MKALEPPAIPASSNGPPYQPAPKGASAAAAASTQSSATWQREMMHRAAISANENPERQAPKAGKESQTPDLPRVRARPQEQQEKKRRVHQQISRQGLTLWRAKRVLISTTSDDSGS